MSEASELDVLCPAPAPALPAAAVARLPRIDVPRSSDRRWAVTGE